MLRLRNLLFVGTILSLMAAFVAQAYSQSPKTITIQPFLQDLTILPSQPKKDFSFQLINNTASPASFKLSAVDFGTLDDTGGLIFAGASSSQLIQKYGLANWISLASQNVNLQPSQKITVIGAIENRADLAPGGHYAAILITSTSAQPKAGQTNVSLKPIVSALILAKKIGGERYDLHLDSLSTNGNWFSLPSVVDLRFKNPGNIHVVPRGIVKLIDSRGNVVKQGIINQESRYILPERHRILSVPLSKIGKASLLSTGYKLQVDYRYDGINKYARKTMQVHYAAPIFILGLILIVVAIWLLWHRRIRHK
jgi:hypothetical protein